MHRRINVLFVCFIDYNDSSQKDRNNNNRKKSTGVELLAAFYTATQAFTKPGMSY
jgi:hypothetical protein